jgi:branched-chain amino acid transport system substrate-binding protein
MEVIEQAVKATGGTNDEKLAEHLRKTTYKTVVGDVAFNEQGEWATAQVMAVQFQGVSGNGVEQFTNPKTEVILWPKKYKTGDIAYPYNPKG